MTITANGIRLPLDGLVRVLVAVRLAICDERTASPVLTGFQRACRHKRTLWHFLRVNEQSPRGEPGGLCFQPTHLSPTGRGLALKRHRSSSFDSTAFSRMLLANLCRAHFALIPLNYFTHVVGDQRSILKKMRETRWKHSALNTASAAQIGAYHTGKCSLAKNPAIENPLKTKQP